MTLQSRKTIEGPFRAPNRAMYKAMGLHEADLDKPLTTYYLMKKQYKHD